LSCTGPKILLYTFLTEIFIFFLSLFVSFQFSDAYVNVLSIIVYCIHMKEIKCLIYQTDFYTKFLVFAPTIFLKILFCPFIFLLLGKLCARIILMSLRSAAIHKHLNSVI
jgi:hypothetical protein